MLEPPEGDALRRALDDRLQGGAKDPLETLAQILASSRPGRDLAGTRRGRFQLLRLLGLGGMGATYEAMDLEHQGARVAVKVFGTLSAAQRERFDREWRILKTLDHPGIVRYEDHGITPEGDAWLAMDLVEGQSLEELLSDLERGEPTGEAAFSLLAESNADVATLRSDPGYRRRVLRILAKVAEALAHAHQAGVIHRDIKPANILVQQDLEPVLVDFGLSRDLFENVSLTRSGAVLGTLAYMAPEQLRGQSDTADARTDVYALGLVLFRCLLGHDLRQEPRDALRIRHFVLRQADARQVPAELQAILYRCLELKPARRYSGAQELAGDLRAALGTGAVSARRPSRVVRILRGRFGMPITVAAMAILIATLTFAFWPGQPYFISIDAINDCGDTIKLDGERLGTPISGRRTTPGRHEIEYSYPGTALPILRVIDIPEDRHWTRVNLLSMGTGSSKFSPDVNRVLFQGSLPAFLHVQIEDETDVLLVDGNLVEPGHRWVQVAPGPHAVELRAKSGLREVQRIVTPSHEASSLQILATQLRQVAGSFRLTLGNVVSPLPKEITLQLSDGAVPFVHDTRDEAGDPRRREVQYLVLRTSLTAEVPDKDVEAILRVDFPEVMRSGVFWMQSEAMSREKCLCDYRTDGGPWQDLKQDTAGLTVLTRGLIEVKVPDTGMRRFELRGRLRSSQSPVGAPTVIHLWGYLDDPAISPPCFAIVADPDPTRARMSK